MINIDDATISRVNTILYGISKGPEKVFANAANRALTSGKTAAVRGINKTYRIKQRDLTENSRVSIKKATTANTEGYIKYAGNVIPLIKFSVSPSTPKHQTVKAAVLGGGGTLAGAYVADLGRFGVGVFERLTRKRASSFQLYGPSAAQMAANDDVTRNVDARTAETFEKRVEHEITRILNNYGG